MIPMQTSEPQAELKTALLAGKAAKSCNHAVNLSMSFISLSTQKGSLANETRY